ncbi:MAG TPA: APC family permease [Candidatus Sulfotelmatobacter sp.]|nr:APC family permease [Candidatus Sulfotelmatobacter sp.]
MATTGGVQQYPGVFTRASSGLVRQVGTLDTAFYGMMQIGIPYIIFIIASWVSYPGASMELATALTIIGSVCLGVTYALYSAVYPRSGGEYVFLSRTVHPAYGFVVSFVQVFWQAFYFGVTGAFWAIYGWSPLFTTLGLQLKSQALLNLGTFFGSNWGIFLTGVVMIVFLGGLLMRGARGYFMFQRWSVWIALASVLLVIIVLALTAASVFNFKGSFDALAGSGAYDKVIATARSGGTDLNPALSFGATMSFLIWPAFSILFAINSVSFSGEIKNVKRGQLIGISGAMVWAGLIMIALMFFIRSAVGNQFLLAASSVGSKFPLPISPWLNLLASIAANNPLLTILMNLYVLLLIPYAGGAGALYASRALMAWGLDGVAPEKVAQVSDRYHSPVWAVAVAVVIALVALTIYAFTALLATLSGLIGFATAFCLTALAAIVFPRIKKDAYQGSPAAITVAGIPLISICAVVASITLLWVIYRAIVDAAFGANTAFSLWLNAAVIVAAVAWYVIARWYRMRQGVDVAARYREIPVE